MVALICEDDFMYSPEALHAIASPVLKGDVDVAIGVSKTIERRISSWAFWKFMQRVSHRQITGRELMFRCMSPKMVREFRQYDDAIRSVAALSLEIGMRTKRVPIDGFRTGIRASGQSFNDRVQLFTEIYFSLSRRPLYVILYGGLFFLLSGFLTVPFAILLREVGIQWIELATAAVTGGLLSLSGTLMICSWVILQAVAISIRESRARPLATIESDSLEQ